MILFMILFYFKMIAVLHTKSGIQNSRIGSTVRHLSSSRVRVVVFDIDTILASVERDLVGE